MARFFRLGFTLVELLVAVAVITVGMVFVLGAFNRCMASLSTAHRMITASHLLDLKMWEIDLAHYDNNGSEEGAWGETFAEPYQRFNWSQVIGPVTADLTSEVFGNNTSQIFDKTFAEETVAVSWVQGRVARNVSVSRYVRRKQNETQ